MSRKLELGSQKTCVPNLREQSARIILKIVRSQGHPYVELRESGKKFIYFCVLCLAPCYSDTVLFDHLKGNLHNERLSSARLTLLKPNPWPFSDGLVFFDTSTEKDEDSKITNANRNRLLKLSDNDDDLAIVKFGEESQSDVQPISTDSTLDDDSTLVIPRLLFADETCDVKVKEIGWGKIAARFVKKHGSLNGNGIRRMWCEWLGKENSSQQESYEVPEHDFAVVIFPYSYDLGRQGLLDDIKSLLPSAPVTEPKTERESGQKRKAPLSDPEDAGNSLGKEYDSPAKESPAANNAPSTSTLDQCNSQLLRTKFISSKAVRKEMRRLQRQAAEKVCNICQQKMIPGKDVAALLNLKTGRIACCSRNPTGAFHVFHTSCVIHWILFCEYEIITNRSVDPNVSQEGKRQEVSNRGVIIKERDIKHVLCPECQGTGVIVEDGLEYPEKWFSLSQMFRSKLKTCEARIQWIQSPENLQNCSIGFHFPSQIQEIVEEKVESIKLLHFYRADDQSVKHKNCANVT